MYTLVSLSMVAVGHALGPLLLVRHGRHFRHVHRALGGRVEVLKGEVDYLARAAGS